LEGWRVGRLREEDRGSEAQEQKQKQGQAINTKF